MSDVFGKKLGQYILLEQLGEGGMAKVYNALDTRADRNVAIKVILPSKRTSGMFLQQFELEAKALANLTHTNIVKVLNYGVQDGQPFLVMEYVPGGTLKEVMGQKLPWQTAAAILAPIARALEYVHQHHIVHRDVKPSNILLQDDFRPMLSDFGILKLLEGKEEKVESAIGAGIGTPEYMSPEQGMGKEVDFRADIYSLGLIFYEMITGQKPYTADTPMAMVIKHVTDELPLPTSIDKNIPKFVERAILRAVQKEPQDRYLSMSHFADVLELIALGDKALTQKITKAALEKEKRQRSISIVTLSFLLLFLITGTSLLIYNYLLRPTFFSTPAILSTSTPIPPQTVIITATSAPTQTPLPVAATESTAQFQAVSSPSVTLLETPLAIPASSQFQEIARWGIGGVNVVRWSPDGQSIALGTTSGIFIYDTQTKKMIRFIDTQFNVLVLAYNLAGDQITAGSPTGTINVWNPETGEQILSYIYKRPASETITSDLLVTSIFYSSDGKNVVVGYRNGAINYFPVDQGTPVLTVENYPTVHDLVISADKRYIYASNGSRDIIIWDIQTGKKDLTILSNPAPVHSLVLSADQQILLAGGDNTVYLWDLFEAKNVSSYPNLGGQVTDMGISYDNKYAAIALKTGDIKVFEIPVPSDYSKTHLPVQSIKGYDEEILSLEFSPDGVTVATGNHKEDLKFWNAETGEEMFVLGQSMRGIDEIYLSNDGQWLATAHEDNLVRVWNVMQAKEAFPAFEGSLSKGIPFSPDNRFLAFVYSPGRYQEDLVRILELRTGKIVAELPGYKKKDFIQFTDDTKLLVIGDPFSAKIWDVSTWEQVNTHGGPTAGCGQYSTPQSKLLALISNAGVLFTYDQKVEKMCGTKPSGVTLVYYFYENHKMVFVLGNGTLWVWDFDPIEKYRLETSGEPYPLSGEIFLAGDQASGWYAYKDLARDQLSLQNINTNSGTTIAQQEDYQYRIALLPEKKLIALGSRYGSIHIWTMP